MFFAGALSLKEVWGGRSHSKAEVLSLGLEVKMKSKLTLDTADPKMKILSLCNPHIKVGNS